ncbi:MAG: hypothetical protein H0W76_07075 [Pyrinomonadaceae bacterium]|nr:hypothetical protein [Pyrinomonadaceae bacterium]
MRRLSPAIAQEIRASNNDRAGVKDMLAVEVTPALTKAFLLPNRMRVAPGKN